MFVFGIQLECSISNLVRFFSKTILDQPRHPQKAIVPFPCFLASLNATKIVSSIHEVKLERENSYFSAMSAVHASRICVLCVCVCVCVYICLLYILCAFPLRGRELYLLRSFSFYYSPFCS